MKFVKRMACDAIGIDSNPSVKDEEKFRKIMSSVKNIERGNDVRARIRRKCSGSVASGGAPNVRDAATGVVGIEQHLLARHARDHRRPGCAGVGRTPHPGR